MGKRTQSAPVPVGGRRLLRPRQIQQKLSIGNTRFWEYVKQGRIRLVNVGPRSRAAPEEEIDALIDQLMAERDA